MGLVQTQGPEEDSASSPCVPFLPALGLRAASSHSIPPDKASRSSWACCQALPRGAAVRHSPQPRSWGDSHALASRVPRSQARRGLHSCPPALLKVKPPHRPGRRCSRWYGEGESAQTQSPSPATRAGLQGRLGTLPEATDAAPEPWVTLQ